MPARGVLRALRPQRRRVQETELVARRSYATLPPAEQFFQNTGTDLLITVWEFIHEGNLKTILPLMLVSKGVYRRLTTDVNLLREIAKHSFSFLYLSYVTTESKTFQRLLRFSRPQSGAELGFNEWSKQQLLRNTRMRKRPPYTVHFKVRPTQIYTGGKTHVVVGRAPFPFVEKLKRILKQFEESHNAIEMKIFLPERNHYPFALHNSTVRFLLSVPEEEIKIGEWYRATCFVSFHTRFLRYGFKLRVKHWRPLSPA